MTVQTDLFAPCPYPNPPAPQPIPNPPNPPKDTNPPNSTNARKLVAQVIEAAQDFEFYPTTSEIIGALIRDAGINDSRNEYGNHFESRGAARAWLDIGAGNGKVLMALQKASGNRLTLHAIEKSTILCQQLPAEILIVGTEFHEQSLLSKQVDVIFCNPPYTEFEDWSEKIIRQSACQTIYLVIPQRWEKSTRIADAIKFRDATVKKVGSFDFENAEDRAARAQVHLLRVTLQTGDRYSKENNDAFERFFAEQFADLIAKFKANGRTPEDPDREGQSKSGRNFASLVAGPTYPEALVNLYRAEMANVERNYELVSKLDADLLKEFEISPPRIMACLKTRLSGLRNDYWHELFSRLSKVTDRLTTASRKSLLDVLHRHVEVDFTVSNICAVLIWVIKNANRYIDSQVLEVYELMVDKCNVHLYKSNQRTWRDEQWRYSHRDDTDRPSHFSLDYRIVTHRVGGYRTGYSSWDTGLEERGRDFLADLLTIAHNLRFECSTVDKALIRGGEQWTAGEQKVFYFTNKNGVREILFDVRAFKNGNMHLRLNQDFILALNVEHGRLKGWLRSAEEAVVELNDNKAGTYFNRNLQLANGNPTLLLS